MKARNDKAKTPKRKMQNDFSLSVFRFPFSACLRFFVLIIFFSTFAAAQKIAVIAPEKTGHSEKSATEIVKNLSAKTKVLDGDLSGTAFRSAGAANPFNLSSGAAKTIGAAIGCEFFVLVKSANQRRSTFEKKDFYESYAAVYAISARTGRLVFWKLQSFEDASEAQAEKLLFAATGDLASEIFHRLKIVSAAEINETAPPKIEEVPAANAADARNFRPPMPFRRIKPEYTRLAYIYDVTATIDATVDIGASGEIMRVEIERWAGFGLDEAVVEAVRRMNWRPAERNGKSLPMRVLLRYNFRRIEKEEN